MKATIQDCRDIASYYQPLKVGSAEIKITPFKGGRLAGYLHTTSLKAIFDVPILYINSELYMSITQMEIDSHNMHIREAEGDVLVGGLGLGYYLTQILHKEEVTSVTVVEKSIHVIEVYKKLQESNPIFKSDKLTIVHDDVFLFKSDTVFDYAYFDIWPSMDFGEAMEDVARMQEDENFDAKRYAFWGMDRWLYEAMEEYAFEGASQGYSMREYLELKILNEYCDFEWALDPMTISLRDLGVIL